MYTLNIDKNEIFEAVIHADGMDSNIKPKCRLIVESSRFNLLFEGTIQNNKCNIPIKKLKNILEEGDTGRLRLEVIADDVFFTPWEQDFTARVSKKLTVEVKSSESITNKPKIAVVSVNSENQNVGTDLLIKELKTSFAKYGISILNVEDKKKHIRLITEAVLKTTKFNKLNLNQKDLINIVIKSLTLK